MDPLHYMQRVHWTLPNILYPSILKIAMVLWTLYIICKGSIGPFLYIYIFVLTFGEVQIMDLLYVVFGPFTTKKKLKDVGRRLFP